MVVLRVLLLVFSDDGDGAGGIRSEMGPTGPVVFVASVKST